MLLWQLRDQRLLLTITSSSFSSLEDDLVPFLIRVCERAHSPHVNCLRMHRCCHDNMTDGSAHFFYVSPDAPNYGKGGGVTPVLSSPVSGPSAGRQPVPDVCPGEKWILLLLHTRSSSRSRLLTVWRSGALTHLPAAAAWSFFTITEPPPAVHLVTASCFILE